MWMSFKFSMHSATVKTSSSLKFSESHMGMGAVGGGGDLSDHVVVVAVGY